MINLSFKYRIRSFFRKELSRSSAVFTSGKKSVIERLFNDKYPYEYLDSDGGKTHVEQIVKFYRERGL